MKHPGDPPSYLDRPPTAGVGSYESGTSEILRIEEGGVWAEGCVAQQKQQREREEAFGRPGKIVDYGRFDL